MVPSTHTRGSTCHARVPIACPTPPSAHVCPRVKDLTSGARPPHGAVPRARRTEGNPGLESILGKP
eukprot:1044066-Pyramimonas_sp.AAC.1